MWESQSNCGSQESVQSRYFRIKVKQQNYLGKPALAIYLSDYTDKIKDKLNNLIRQELHDKAQTSESFGSTVSHEMRTPLASVIFFVKLVISAFQMKQLTEQQKAESLKYCKLMLSQIYLLQSFVEDLLDLRQMRDGAFSLSSAPFDPNETFELICSSFEPQVQVKRVKLIFATANGQLLPKLVGDGKRFQQVVINLVKNAMKFTQAG